MILGIWRENRCVRSGRSSMVLSNAKTKKSLSSAVDNATVADSLFVRSPDHICFFLTE